MNHRTPTPEIDQIWNRTAQTQRWHHLWLRHLDQQTTTNPRHPGHGDWTDYNDASHDYDSGTDSYRHTWHKETDRIEQTTRHDLQAELTNLNTHANGADTLHLGLTSADITDTATQQAIHESLATILTQTATLTRQLAETAHRHRDLRIVARTHGQPAQLTTYGHRIATVLSPLLDWYDRTNHTLQQYPMRPPHGAVGTAADLHRVLNGWQPTPEPTDQPCWRCGAAIAIPPTGEMVLCGCGAVHRKGSTTGPGASPSASEPPAGTSGGVEDREALRDAVVTGMKAAGLSVAAANVGLRAAGLRTIDAPDDSAIIGCPRCGSILSAFASQCAHPWHTDNQKPAQLPPMDADVQIQRYTEKLAGGLQFEQTMDATRQTYHRSYDLPIASAMVELASIAATWATDRRLEAVLGLGNERRDADQVGSSAMAHKTNPVLAERIYALASVTRSHYTAMAELAMGGWLEGDVSTSAARREILPALFSNVSAILTNWAEADRRWQIDELAITTEIESNRVDLSTGAVLQWLVELGIDRSHAHSAIRGASVTHEPLSFRGALQDEFDLSGPAREQLRTVMDEVLAGPIGNAAAQVDRVVARARQVH